MMAVRHPMEELRRALKPKRGKDALGRAPFGRLIDKSAESVKNYERRATDMPDDVIQRCIEIAKENNWPDLVARFEAEAKGEPVTSSGDETAAAIRELSAKIEQLAKGLGVRLPPTSNRGKK